ncbi:hydrogenase expression/formation protein HypE, partial [Geitlerinema sp. P-1104]|nr:hydrogenase expression/formation protein HypE [Geitlerinema sp. P-1104]
MSDFDVASLSCPLPIEQYPHVLLAHGGGGRLMQQLINQVFLPAFGSSNQVQHDAATLMLEGDR